MKFRIWLVLITAFILQFNVNAQGPPITGDKAIMLSRGNIVIKTLTEFRKTEDADFLRIPIMGHYILNNKMLVGIHVPFVNSNFTGSDEDEISSFDLGDIELLGKYQFYRKDQTGKTFRVAAKTLQTLPTGQAFNIDGIQTKRYQSYVGVIAGYETIKYGISNELGYNIVPNSNRGELRYKLGFGLPLLKQVYPVKQINLYFEYDGHWFIEAEQYLLQYAQGIQFAIKQLTLEASVQLPLTQNLITNKREYTIYFGSRYVF